MDKNKQYVSPDAWTIYRVARKNFKMTCILLVLQLVNLAFNILILVRK